MLTHAEIKAAAAAAVEDAGIQRKLQELKDKKDRMEQCMAEVRSMQVHSGGQKHKADELS